MTRPCQIRITTEEPGQPDKVDEIDHNNRKARRWLDRHIQWAMRAGQRRVTLEPIQPDPEQEDPQ